MKKTLLLNFFHLLLILVLGVVLYPHDTSAQTCPNGRLVNGVCTIGYVPLEPIPGITPGDVSAPDAIPKLANSLFTILFTIGALFSVLMLTLSGVRYMLSDIVTDKARAIKRIQACLYGLLILAGAWLTLYTINPQLLNFTLTPGAARIDGATTPTTLGLDAIAQHQDNLTAAASKKYSAAECDAARQWLSDNGVYNGLSTEAANLNGQLLRGRDANNNILSSDQKDALRSRLSTIAKETNLNVAIKGSCDSQ